MSCCALFSASFSVLQLMIFVPPEKKKAPTRSNVYTALELATCHRFLKDAFDDVYALVKSAQLDLVFPSFSANDSNTDFLPRDYSNTESRYCNALLGELVARADEDNRPLLQKVLEVEVLEAKNLSALLDKFILQSSELLFFTPSFIVKVMTFSV